MSVSREDLVRKGRRAVGKGDSNCSKGEGCACCWGRGVFFVFVFWGGKGNLSTEGEGRVEGWEGGEGELRGVVTQGEKGRGEGSLNGGLRDKRVAGSGNWSAKLQGRGVPTVTIARLGIIRKRQSGMQGK